MHELSVTQGILDIAINKAKEAGASRITAINLVIGEMSNVIDDCVQFYFDMLSRDSIASGARLNFTRIPMKVHCRHCGFTFIPGKITWGCPQCGQWHAQVVAGQEFYMESIEVE